MLFRRKKNESGLPLTAPQIEGRIRRAAWLVRLNGAFLGINSALVYLDWNKPPLLVPCGTALLLAVFAFFLGLHNHSQWRNLLAKREAFDVWWAGLPESTREYIEHQRKATQELERICRL